jgi:S-adenosylmethionine:tRNA ribosyltransferase-isomerase
MDARALEFDLPERLIATQPAEPRDAARLLVCSRSDPDLIEHVTFRDLPRYLDADDTLVFNRSGVVPARIAGRRTDSGGKVDGLFIEERDAALTPASAAPREHLTDASSSATPLSRWRVMLKSNGTLRRGQSVRLHVAQAEVTNAAESPFTITLRERDDDTWLVDVHHSPNATPADSRSDPSTRDEDPGAAAMPAVDILARVGATPLPPYILRARAHADVRIDDALDRDWYQTIYADRSRARSVAAPTAGLHFTPDLLDRLRQQGVNTEDVFLHVGPGTFKPIDEDAADISTHVMHAESIEVAADTLARLDAIQPPARRVLVGTTAVRTLESIPRPLTPEHRARGAAGETDLFITPGFALTWTDALITNFHLPRSTLLTLVGALFPEGVSRLLDLYRHAIDRNFRFVSYGDAMLILP